MNERTFEIQSNSEKFAHQLIQELKNGGTLSDTTHQALVQALLQRGAQTMRPVATPEAVVRATEPERSETRIEIDPAELQEITDKWFDPVALASLGCFGRKEEATFENFYFHRRSGTWLTGPTSVRILPELLEGNFRCVGDQESNGREGRIALKSLGIISLSEKASFSMLSYAGKANQGNLLRPCEFYKFRDVEEAYKQSNR